MKRGRIIIVSVYKKITIITGILTFISFIFGIRLYYCFPGNSDMNFFVNVCLAIFGSSMLSMFTAWITYFSEKRKTMEGFAYCTRRILKVLSHYDESMTLDEKIKFFIAYYDESMDEWDANFGNMDFFFEFYHHNRKYVYDEIYSPITAFNKMVGRHVWHFRFYLNSSVRNDAVMDDFVKELEDVLIVKTTSILPNELAEDGTNEKYTRMISVEPKLVRDIKEELNGRYYKCMYPRNIRK